MNRASAPLFATVNVTTDCNLDCAYCFMQPRSGEFMSEADFTRVVSELVGLNLFFINLSGGEPFLHPQFDRFLEIAHAKFQHVMVLTNGTSLKEEHFTAIDKIVRRKKAFTMQVSLDSVVPEVNAATRGQGQSVVKNIRALTTLGVQVIVAIVVTNRNLNCVIETISALSQYTRFFHLMTVQDVRSRSGIEAEYHFAANFEQETPFWEKIRNLAREQDLVINTPLNYEGERGCASGAPCMAAFSHVVIDPSLKVRPCDRLTDVVIGDLRKSRLTEIWNSPQSHAILGSKIPFCRLPVGGTAARRGLLRSI